MAFLIICTKNFLNYPEKSMQLDSIFNETARLKSVTYYNTKIYYGRDFSWSAEKEKDVLKFQKFQKNFFKMSFLL